MDCSILYFPVHHQLLELAQTHVHQLGDVIQPSHPLSSPSAYHLSQHQGLFQWVISSYQVARVLELQLQHHSFQWIFRTDWFHLGLTGLISMLSKGLPRVFSNTTVQKHQFFSTQLSLWSNSHIHTWLLEIGKVISLLFNTVPRFVIAFLPRSMHLLISWLQSPYAVTLEPKKIKSLTVSIVSPSICCEVMGLDAMILAFWMLSFKSAFSLSSFTFIKRFFSSSLLSAVGWCHLHICGYWYFSQQSWFQLVLHPAWQFAWCTLHIS